PVCGTTVIEAGTTHNYWLHELDSVGNFLQKMSGVTWAENGSIVGASSAGANDAVEIAFETAGLGHLEYDIGSGEQTLDCAPVFNVKAAPAKRFRITNQNGAPG